MQWSIIDDKMLRHAVEHHRRQNVTPCSGASQTTKCYAMQWSIIDNEVLRHAVEHHRQRSVTSCSGVTLNHGCYSGTWCFFEPYTLVSIKRRPADNYPCSASKTQLATVVCKPHHIYNVPHFSRGKQVRCQFKNHGNKCHAYTLCLLCCVITLQRFALNTPQVFNKVGNEVLRPHFSTIARYLLVMLFISFNETKGIFQIQFYLCQYALNKEKTSEAVIFFFLLMHKA